MRVLLIEHDSTMSVKEIAGESSSLVPAGVVAETDDGLLPVYIRDMNSAVNEYLIDRLRKIYPPV